MYHAGTYQTGLPSREAPYVTPLTGQSSWQTGLSHVGGFSTAIKLALFRCTAKLQTMGRNRYQCTGSYASVVRLMARVIGYVYHSNFRAGYALRGGLANASRSIYRASAVMAQSLASRYRITAVLAIGVTARYRLTGLCQANYAAIYHVTAALKQQLRQKVRITGVLQANYRSRYLVKAVLWQFTAARYRLTGLLGYGAMAAYRTAGALRQSMRGFYRVDGDLANTLGKWFIRVTGKINIAAFVSAVPKRIQEFITNKTWFK